VDLLRRVRTRIKEHDVSMIAAGVGFYAVLAIFPALIAAVSIYALVADPTHISSQLGPITKTLPPGAGDLITGQLTGAAQANHGGVTAGLIISLLGALWAASNGVNALNRGLAIIYDVERERSSLKRRALSLALTVGAIVVALIALALIAVFPVLLHHVGLGPAAQAGADVIRWLLFIVLITVAIGVLYRINAPSEQRSWRFISRGVLTAVTVWIIGSVGFSLYVGNFGSYNKTYGSLAAVIVLLFWLYLSAFAILLGAVVDAESAGAPARGGAPRHQRPAPAR
jgi:membrane protein